MSAEGHILLKGSVSIRVACLTGYLMGWHVLSVDMFY